MVKKRLHGVDAVWYRKNKKQEKKKFVQTTDFI